MNANFQIIRTRSGHFNLFVDGLFAGQFDSYVEAMEKAHDPR